jgi:hypothetical protein
MVPACPDNRSRTKPQGRRLLAGAPPAEIVSKLGVGWARVLASPELPEFRERLGLPSTLALPFETLSARPSPTIESSCGGLPPALPAGWRGVINRHRDTEWKQFARHGQAF